LREIKFRGIGNARGVDYFGKFIYGDLIHIGGEAFIQNDDKAPDVIAIRVDPKTIGQFTGLHDKNGKEIYEGDILKEIAPRGYIYRVFSAAGGFVINAFQDEITMLRFAEPIANMQTAGYIQEQCEVIGNIHENPELLEVTK